MTKEEKQLLLVDLCARLPYGVIVQDRNGTHILTLGNTELGTEYIKPYLRPMSSMTEEEQEEYDKWHEELEEGRIKDWKYAEYNGWLNAHHLDYHGLIKKGLALEAPEGMYKTE